MRRMSRRSGGEPRRRRPTLVIGRRINFLFFATPSFPTTTATTAASQGRVGERRTPLIRQKAGSGSGMNDAGGGASDVRMIGNDERRHEVGSGLLRRLSFGRSSTSFSPGGGRRRGGSESVARKGER